MFIRYKTFLMILSVYVTTALASNCGLFETSLAPHYPEFELSLMSCSIKCNSNCGNYAEQEARKGKQTELISSGAGYFTSKFSLSEEGISYISPLAIESIKSIPVKAGNIFTIAEYGCADGGTSMPLMYACVKNLRELYGNDLEIHIYYEDKPENDFNSLFYFLQGLLPGPPSYLADFPNVFVSANGTNFYYQCFPSGSVNFGFSCMAAQWLSRKPCSLTKAVLHCLSEVPDERDQFNRQAEKDWERFLLMRAKELSKGGRLALIMFVDGDYNSSFDGGAGVSRFPLYNGLYKVVEGMAKDQIITEDEIQEMTIPEYYRTKAELIKPFMSVDSPVCKAGLSLVSVELKESPLPEMKLWQQTGDATLVAKMLTEQTRAWGNIMVLSALNVQRSKEEKTEIVNEFFSRLETDILCSPKDYMASFWSAFIIIEKSF